MIAGIVPAAGLSSRMGRPKLLMPIRGETLIHQVVIALLKGGVDRVVVVAPPANSPEGPAVADEAGQAGADVIVPETRPAEMRHSVELGLERFRQGNPTPELVLLTPGDVPGIDPEVVARLCELALARPGHLVVPGYEGRRGHPLVLPWGIAARIPMLPPGEGINALVARQQDLILEMPVSNSELFVDLDTPDDLVRWQSVRLFPANVRLFALAKERMGRAEVRIDLPPAATVADLRSALRVHSPELGSLWSSALIAVDEEYASDDVSIRPGSQLAVIPPVSGGTEIRSTKRHGLDTPGYNR